MTKRLVAGEEVMCFARHQIPKADVASSIGIICLAARGGEMLSLFGRPVLQVVGKAFSKQDPERRTNFLSIAWSIMTNAEDEERPEMLQEIILHILPLLSDRSFLLTLETEHPVEIEYEEYRVCDEAYLLLRYLQDPDYDDDLFRELD